MVDVGDIASTLDPKDLEKKAGPLPVWVWGIGIGGTVLVGYWWYRNHSASATGTASTSGADTTATDTGVNPGSVGIDSDYGDTDGTLGDTSGDDTTSTAPTTNTAWETEVLTYLTSQGNDPITTEIALEDYINGVALSAAQATIVNEAITYAGLPPEGVAGTPIVTSPTPATPTSPTPATPAKTYSGLTESRNITKPPHHVSGLPAYWVAKYDVWGYFPPASVKNVSTPEGWTLIDLGGNSRALIPDDAISNPTDKKTGTAPAPAKKAVK